MVWELGVETPHIHLVPKDFFPNLYFRKHVIELGAKDTRTANTLWQMCKEDILFWINTFVFTYDPRIDPACVPFITWEFQDEVILEVQSCIGHMDIRIEKSRDMGATWCCLMVIEHQWIFEDEKSFMLGSRKESLVDERGNSDALMWKLDYVVDRLPSWMCPRYTRKSLNLINLDNLSTIDGESTNGNIGRGGRRTAALLDEFGAMDNQGDVDAATANNTNCRIFLSTPKGVDTLFHAQREKPDRAIRKIYLHWRRHPEHAVGLYETDENGGLRILDMGFPFDADYPFLLDNKVRSPWYDLMCDRLGSPLLVAQELDMDPIGAASPYFDVTNISHLKKKFGRDPSHIGELEYDQDELTPIGFYEVEKGRFKLWGNWDLDGDGKVKPKPEVRYGIGGDVSAGSGASNSCLSIGNLETGEKVGEYSNPYIPPHEFARLAIALARWLNNAYLIWDATGTTGASFNGTYEKTGYTNIYMTRDENKMGAKVSNKPGFYCTPGYLDRILGNYRRGLDDSLRETKGKSKTKPFFNPSVYALDECLKFIVAPSGNAVFHSGSRNSIDPSGAGKSHADIVIADALLYRAMSGRSGVREKQADDRAVPGTLAYRHRKASAFMRQRKTDFSYFAGAA